MSVIAIKAGVGTRAGTENNAKCPSGYEIIRLRKGNNIPTTCYY